MNFVSSSKSREKHDKYVLFSVLYYIYCIRINVFIVINLMSAKHFPPDNSTEIQC